MFRSKRLSRGQWRGGQRETGPSTKTGIPGALAPNLKYESIWKGQALGDAVGLWGKKKFGEKPRQNLGSTGLQYTLGETYSTPEQTLATLQVILLTANPAGASTPRMLLQSTVRMRAVFTVSHKIRPWLLVIIKEQYFWRGRTRIVLS